jgi:hypothetical protein
LEMQGLRSITEFRSRSNVQGGGSAEIKKDERGQAASIDWTKYPFELKPLKTEKERYDAVRSVSDPMIMVGPCGWETYANVLLAQHNEWKRWYSVNVPRDQLNVEGYPKQSFPISQIAPFGGANPTAVDKLISDFIGRKLSSQCKDPNKVFTETTK